MRALRGEAVDVDHLAIDDTARTAVMFRERRALGAMDVVYHRAGSAGSRVTAQDVDRAADDGVFDGARWLHLTGITPSLSQTAREATTRALESGREAGLTISLDINLRRRLWSDQEAAPVIRDLASRVDVVLGSADELAVVADLDPDTSPERLARAVAAIGPGTVVAKLGRDGALGLEGELSVVEPGIVVDQVVDPVGAGDAFCAGFIAGRLDGVDLRDCSTDGERVRRPRRRRERRSVGLAGPRRAGATPGRRTRHAALKRGVPGADRLRGRG